jgi:hypothetical protein
LTQAKVVEVARQYAFEFVKSPAYHLIWLEITAALEEMQKLIRLYQEAAKLSCKLWIGRRTLQCLTLKDMAGKAFDLENSVY